MRMEGGSSTRHPAKRSVPLVSIITVAFNAAVSLPEVLESIFPLQEEDVEIIVIDGGSNDGTVAWLQAHDASIAYWLSEPDRGIYDAMNKAIGKANGTWLLHLNAGDKLLSVPRRELEQASRDGLDIAAFSVLLDGKHKFCSAWGTALCFTNTLHHQGTFFLRSSFPGYDSSYRIFADFDANQRLALAGAKAKMFDKVVACHETGGVSNENNSAAAEEFFSVIRKNYGRKALPISWLICKWQGLQRRLNPS